MRAPLIILILALIISVATDIYLYARLRHASRPHPLAEKSLLGVAILSYLLLIVAAVIPARDGDDTLLRIKMWTLFGFISIFIPKLLAALFDLVASIPLLFHRKRLSWLSTAGSAVGLLLFAGFWWGALVNRFNIDVVSCDIPVEGLPESFDGFTILQFSDLHTGTYAGDTTFVNQLVDTINARRPDLIVFTGDIVNRQSSEILPFISTLSRLQAPCGVVAILGNHDYGDYKEWRTPAEKSENMELLYDSYRKAGFRLLRNETVFIHRGNDSIAVIGVENIGDPPFPVYGSLTKAYPTPGDPLTKILLSHNPAHWTDSIADNKDINIPLTLAGHTHAMQIEMLGVSPAAWRYKTWGGLYADTDSIHRLYVNIGAGTVGMPMRLGATPEITLLTLRRR